MGDETDALLHIKKKSRNQKRKFKHTHYHEKPAFSLIKDLTIANPNLQIIGASATINTTTCQRLIRARSKAQKYSRVRVIGKNTEFPRTISHYFAMVASTKKKYDRWKVQKKKLNGALCLWDSIRVKHFSGGRAPPALVFIDNHSNINNVLDYLESKGAATVALHEVWNETEARLNFLQIMEQKQLDLIVATEALVRGLDLSNLSDIFVTSKPGDALQYLHLSGRVGRIRTAAACDTKFSHDPSIGRVSSILTHWEHNTFLNMKKRLNVQFKKVSIPDFLPHSDTEGYTIDSGTRDGKLFQDSIKYEKKWKQKNDFNDNKAGYVTYLKQNLRSHVTVVRCVQKYSSVQVGDMGIFISLRQGIPSIEVKWGDEGLTYWVRWSDIEIIGSSK